MKTLKAQVIISLITCFFLVLAVTICKGNKFLKAKIQQKAKQELPGYYDIQMTEYR